MSIPNDDSAALLQFDREHLWHPYASMLDPTPVLPVVSAQGVRLTLANGRELIDGTSSWWSAVHGYNHPVLNAAAQKQLQAMSNVMFGGLTHPSAIRLGQLLVDLTPVPLTKVFFSDSGSVAVEVAIKMALQFWRAQDGKKKHVGRKNKLLTVRGGYHGDTFMAMSVCDPVDGMHQLFNGILTEQFFADRPQTRFGEPFDTGDLDSLKELLATHHDDIAALIIEPIFQGAGGMHFYAPDYLQQARKLCNDYDVLLICDEIATGFGRTGKLFACEHAGISPDIMCVGKAITGGYVTLAATLCTDRVAAGICAGEPGALMHGPTFMANALACAIACASIELLISQPWQRCVRIIEMHLRSGLEAARALPNVADVRVLGAIGVIEMHDAIDIRKAQTAFVERGLWVRPFGKIIYAMPPFVMSDDDLRTLTQGMVEVAALL
ncbi:MAG: adenosylmethionine-8-amino-7-oxononanoate aminotransferase [Verrucomicrobiaceae bacterium]|nr:adenosylmethionine-8-amino-7-oxononanoate aminotransferase [Verrucomicrobiaceae bacterium]